MNMRPLLCFLLASGCMTYGKMSPREELQEFQEMHKDMLETMSKMQEEMEKSFEQFKQEQEELFKGLPEPGARASRSGIGVSFEEADNQLHMYLQLPEEVSVNAEDAKAQMEDDTLSISIPHEDGRIELDVTDSHYYIVTKHAKRYMPEMAQDSKEGEKEQSSSGQFVYSSHSQMVESLPVRINPASINKDDKQRITYDEEAHALHLVFDYKRAEPVNIAVEKKEQQTQQGQPEQKNQEASTPTEKMAKHKEKKQKQKNNKKQRQRGTTEVEEDSK